MRNFKDEPTVFIVEDDPSVCQSLRWLFESVNLNVDTYSDAAAYLKAYDPSQHGCILIDIRLPGMSGLQLQELLIQRNIRIPIIIITGHGDVTLAVRAMKMGAKDFILKPFNNELLLEQIQKILTDSYEQQKFYQEFSNRLAQLTAREKEVIELIVRGRLNKQIACDLKISMSTVELHRSHIMQKLEVKTLADLAKIYYLVNPIK